MKTVLLAGAAMLALAGTAVAQDMTTSETKAEATTPAADAAAPVPQSSETAPAPADSTATDSAAAAPADATQPQTETATTAPSDTATQPAMDPAPTAMAAADPAKAQAAASTVEQGWATYDKGGKGALTPLEFGSWVMAARGQDVTADVEKTKASKKAGLPAIKVLNATAGDFAKADSDKNRTVSKEELTAFLSA